MKTSVLTMALLALGSSSLFAGSICPAGSGSNPFPHSPDSAATGCNVVITINANNSTTVTVPDSTPYEESEDVLVGIQNSGSTTVTSLNLAGNDIFGFDGDGICIYTFVGSSYCNAGQMAGTDPGDYQGPTSTFSNFSSFNSGTVNFSPGIAPGGSTYFSLEGVPTANLTATVGGTTGGTGGSASAPALSTWGMILLTMLLVGLSTRMLKRTA